MNSYLSLKVLAAGLAVSAASLAQVPTQEGRTLRAPLTPAGIPQPAQIGREAFTQTSRIRAFNPGPDGRVRSLYLANGSVVDLPPDLSRQVGLAIAKGQRIIVSGSRSDVNGQTVIAAGSLTLHGQTFLAQPAREPLPPPLAFSGSSHSGRPGPAPPLAGPRRRGPDLAAAGPQQTPTANDPGPAAPPPPDGPRALSPRRDRPAPPPEGSRPPAPQPPPDPSGSPQPASPRSSSAPQSPSSGSPKDPNGPTT